MAQRHLFITDPLATLHPSLDTSLRIAFALAERGHETYVAPPWHLSWRAPDPVASVRSCELRFDGGPTSAATGPEELHSLTDFTAIHMRKDPPFDLDYLAATWELESVADRVHVLNHPRALREFNEKLAIFRFPEESREALVSSDPMELLHFIQETAKGDAILKPLMLFGGRGVSRVDLASGAMSASDAYAFLQAETEEGRHARLVQPFDKRIFDGEVRAFTLGGEPISWCLKKPAPGQFLANTRMGARLLPYEPTQEEIERVTRVATALGKHGVAYVGFDLIGGYISEINLTSPRLLQAPGDERDVFGDIAEWLEEHCDHAPDATQRRSISGRFTGDWIAPG